MGTVMNLLTRTTRWKGCSIAHLTTPRKRGSNSSSVPHRLLLPLLVQVLDQTINLECLGLEQLLRDLHRHIQLELSVGAGEAQAHL